MFPIFRRGVVPQQLMLLFVCVGVLIIFVAAQNVGVSDQFSVSFCMVGSFDVVGVCF